jgi:hypothetical protein
MNSKILFAVLPFYVTSKGNGSSNGEFALRDALK